MPIAILYRDELREYDFGPGHPFRGERYVEFYQFLREHLPEDDNYRIIKADWASEEDLLLICQKEYIEVTEEYYRAAHLGLNYSGPIDRFQSGDNIPSGKPGKLEEAARLVIGQAKKACDLVQEGKFKKAVCLGGGLHHAKPDYGEGFCLYNDVAFCARYLLQRYELHRILILDTDAQHVRVVRGHRLGQNAAAAPDVEHALAREPAGDPLDPVEAQRVHPVQRAEHRTFRIPPLVRKRRELVELPRVDVGGNGGRRRRRGDRGHVHWSRSCQSCARATIVASSAVASAPSATTRRPATQTSVTDSRPTAWTRCETGS